jgi:hypothetical protein
MRHVRERAAAKTTRRTTTAAREENAIVVAEVVMFLDLWWISRGRGRELSRFERTGVSAGFDDEG